MIADEDLLKYCKDNNFPVNEMDDNDFRKVENSLGFKIYELKLILGVIEKEVPKTIEKNRI